MSSVVLEAGVDHNLWFWYAACGYPGTMNDINIWDQSELQKYCLSNYCLNYLDFNFEIAGEQFRKLFILVDGIYLPIARFVKGISVPIGKAEKKYTNWQESKQKDSERAFGVFMRKFQCLARPIELHQLKDIKQMIYSCIIMHNMMVEYRIEQEEVDSENMYHLCHDNAAHLLVADEALEEIAATSDSPEDFIKVHLQRAIGFSDNPSSEEIELMCHCWNYLIDDKEHMRLKNALIKHVFALNL